LRVLWSFIAVWLIALPALALFFPPTNRHTDTLSLLESLAGASARLLSEEIRRTVELLRTGTELFYLPSLSNRECLGVLRLLYRQQPDISLLVLLDGSDRAVVEPVYLAAEQISEQREMAEKVPVSSEHLRNFLERIPIREARQSRLAFSDPYVSLETNTVLITGALAVPLEGEETFWVLGFERSLRQLQRLLSAMSSILGSQAFVCDEGGRLVIHPDGDIMLRREPVTQHQLVQLALAGRNQGSAVWEKEDGSRWQGAFWKMDMLNWLVVVEKTVSPDGAGSTWRYLLWGLWLVIGALALVLLGLKERQTLRANEQLYLAASRQAEELKHFQAALLESGKLSALGDLGAGVAHEFNNPLGGILGLTQLLLRRKKPDDPDVNFLQRIEQEAKRCKTITDNLLRFSESQSLDHREPVRVERVLDAALDLVTKKMESKRIQIVREYQAGLPRIVGHDGLLQRAFLNVFFNAETAMPEGGRLTISTSMEGDRVVVNIKDTGVGISAQNLERVFEPFFTTKSNWQGAGLGLTEVYHIVKQHRGEVRLESQEGRGTEVIFYFPAEKAEASNLPVEPGRG